MLWLTDGSLPDYGIDTSERIGREFYTPLVSDWRKEEGGAAAP